MHSKTQTIKAVCDSLLAGDIAAATATARSGYPFVSPQSTGRNCTESQRTGDFIHHPCQLAHPEWASPVDFDQSQSTATRQRLFAELAGTPTLIIGSHFADPSAGHIVRAGSAYRLDI